MANGYTQYEDEIAAIEKRFAREKHPAGGVVFVGSSTMRLWNLRKSFPDLDLPDCGFGGSTIADQVIYYRRLVAPLKPRRIIFYCGGNDLANGLSPQRVLEDYRAWIRLLHADFPDGRVVFLGIRPCESRAGLHAKEQELNRLVRGYSEADPGKRLAYQDMEHTVRNADGTLRKELFEADPLHLNAAGYAVWAREIRPLLKQRGMGRFPPMGTDRGEGPTPAPRPEADAGGRALMQVRTTPDKNR